MFRMQRTQNNSTKKIQELCSIRRLPILSSRYFTMHFRFRIPIEILASQPEQSIKLLHRKTNRKQAQVFEEIGSSQGKLVNGSSANRHSVGYKNVPVVFDFLCDARVKLAFGDANCVPFSLSHVSSDWPPCPPSPGRKHLETNQHRIYLRNDCSKSCGNLEDKSPAMLYAGRWLTWTR